MCLIAFNFDPTRDPWLVLAANRDEFHARPTRPLAWWNGPESLLAGRDEQAGGTWLGVTRTGRWAAVTNFRDPQAPSEARSRGDLPTGFLRNRQSPSDYARVAHDARQHFGPFNLLIGDRNEVWYAGTHAAPKLADPGVHALSNGLLDEPWPKTRRITAALSGGRELSEGEDPDGLFSLLQDRCPAADEELPQTGVGLDRERLLSAPFIVSPVYGTRSTTLVVLGSELRVCERRFDAAGNAVGELDFQLRPGDKPGDKKAAGDRRL